MSDPQSFLQAMYEEECDQARQHESMRRQGTTPVLMLSPRRVCLCRRQGGHAGAVLQFRAVARVSAR
jgi:hypothetical protein